LHLGFPQLKSLQENSLQVSVRVSTADKVCILSQQLPHFQRTTLLFSTLLKLELAHKVKKIFCQIKVAQMQSSRLRTSANHNLDVNNAPGGDYNGS